MSRILMVDDAELFRSLAATLFRRLQCEIVRARDTREVLARAGAIAPDLIVLDADRPGAGGAACVRALKGDPALQGTPVLVLATGPVVDECSAAGADAALARPLSGADLENALGRLGGLPWRRAPRRAARLAARLEAGGVWARGRLKDIGRGGLFLALHPAPEPGADVRVRFRIPVAGGTRGVTALGRVVRRVENDPESHLIAGVGVRFVDLAAGTAACIDRYVGAAADRPGSAGDAGRP